MGNYVDECRALWGQSDQLRRSLEESVVLLPLFQSLRISSLPFWLWLSCMLQPTLSQLGSVSNDGHLVNGTPIFL